MIESKWIDIAIAGEVLIGREAESKVDKCIRSIVDWIVLMQWKISIEMNGKKMLPTIGTNQQRQQQQKKKPNQECPNSHERSNQSSPKKTTLN
ncbi:hypothetical protein BLOT_014811 [Blomia tropicalis]|nr:hypothetical protein BLOT_014811 [Blomia tropicalis]